jgi:hypothetical protein
MRGTSEFSAEIDSLKSKRAGSAASCHVGKGTHIAMTKPSSPMDVADIQRRMAQIRHEMHQEVQGAVRGARTLTEWRSLVRSYPWLSLSVAAAAGYFIVPKRRKETPTVVAVAAHGPEFLANAGSGNKGERPGRTGWTLLGTAFSLLAPIAVRAAQNYALTYFEQWLANHPLPPPGGKEQDGPERPPSGPVRFSGPASRLREY